MHYIVRFKRWQEQHVFLRDAEDHNCQYIYDLHQSQDHAKQFYSLETARAVIEDISSLKIPKKAIEFNASTLFLIRLYGKDWDDQVEGMIIGMDDVIKAQILNEQLAVVETIKLRNQIWNQHYA